MATVASISYNVTEIRDGVYSLVGATIGLAFDIVNQMRADIPELIVLLFLVNIVARLFAPITALFGTVMGIASPKNF